MNQPPSSRFGFLSLNVTQACGAANDNILKQVVVFGLASGGIWADQLGSGGQAIGSFCLAVPFVPFSGFAGQFSDRYSKRDVKLIQPLTDCGVSQRELVERFRDRHAGD